MGLRATKSDEGAAGGWRGINDLRRVFNRAVLRGFVRIAGALRLLKRPHVLGKAVNLELDDQRAASHRHIFGANPRVGGCWRFPHLYFRLARGRRDSNLADHYNSSPF